jgi:predicted GNAT superfamily acetyltransferase
MSVAIRPCIALDFDSILGINAAGAPNVALVDRTELLRLTSMSGVFVVAETPAGIVGYLLAMSSSANYDGEEFQHFRAALEQPFLYIDQVAISPDARRSRVASDLYSYVEGVCRLRDTRMLCCEVNLDPPNPVSLRFHEKRGFSRFGELETRDGRRVTLLNREIQF